MSEKNPFQKKGGAPGPQQQPEVAPQEERPMCPFLGVMPVPQVNKGAIIKPGTDPMSAIQIGAQLMQCQAEHCAIWDATVNACSVKVGMTALVELKSALAKSPFLGG
ncbi:MAG TPA: hypothetical protein VEA41_23185 [Salinarimonas sp.]|nr:hypothetical protein [Salinarimonas sp.]